MAVTIDRTAINAKVNDDGTNTVGSPVDKAFFIDTLFGPIDVALALLRATADDVTMAAGKIITMASGNDLVLNTPSGRSMFFKVNAVTVADISSGGMTMRAGAVLTMESGNDLLLNVPSTRSLFIKVNSVNKVSVDNNGAFGYVAGAGGAVTQATNKSTGVTINTPSGAITMNSAALAGATSVGFTVTNSTVSATDIPVVAIKSGATADAYHAQVDAVGSGTFRISLRNVTAGSLSDAVVLNFAIVKGAAT